MSIVGFYTKDKKKRPITRHSSLHEPIRISEHREDLPWWVYADAMSNRREIQQLLQMEDAGKGRITYKWDGTHNWDSRRSLTQEEIQAITDKANESLEKSFRNATHVYRGIGIPQYSMNNEYTLDSNLADIMTDNGDSVIIHTTKPWDTQGHKHYQCWTTSPSYAFHYGMPRYEGRSMVIAIDTSQIPMDSFKPVKYIVADLNDKPAESQYAYEAEIPWNFWREMEVRSKHEFSVPKSAITIFTQGKRVAKAMQERGFDVVLSKNIFSDEHSLAREAGYE